MGSTANRLEPPGPAGPDTFARLIGELHELGFERSLTASRPHRGVYAATDSSVTLTVVTEPSDPHVQCAGRPRRARLALVLDAGHPRCGSADRVVRGAQRRPHGGDPRRTGGAGR
jgi:hypothetical protein